MLSVIPLSRASVLSRSRRFRVIVLVGAVIAMMTVGCSGPVTPTELPANSITMPTPNGTTGSFSVPATSSEATEPAVVPTASSPMIGTLTGDPPSYAPPDSSWVDTTVQTVKVRRPANWKVATSDSSSVLMLPPTSDEQSAGPEVSLVFLAGQTLAGVAPPPGATETPITVGGYMAWQADDSYLPPFSRYIAIQLPDGVLFAQAYRGPGVDLSQFLTGILSTLSKP